MATNKNSNGNVSGRIFGQRGLMSRLVILGLFTAFLVVGMITVPSLAGSAGGGDDEAAAIGTKVILLEVHKCKNERKPVCGPCEEKKDENPGQEGGANTAEAGRSCSIADEAAHEKRPI